MSNEATPGWIRYQINRPGDGFTNNYLYLPEATSDNYSDTREHIIQEHEHWATGLEGIDLFIDYDVTPPKEEIAIYISYLQDKIRSSARVAQKLTDQLLNHPG